MTNSAKKFGSSHIKPIVRAVKPAGEWTGGAFIDHLEECRRMLDEYLTATIAGARPALLNYLTEQGVPQHIATVVIENQLIDYLTARRY